MTASKDLCHHSSVESLKPGATEPGDTGRDQVEVKSISLLDVNSHLQVRNVATVYCGLLNLHFSQGSLTLMRKEVQLSQQGNKSCIPQLDFSPFRETGHATFFRAAYSSVYMQPCT